MFKNFRKKLAVLLLLTMVVSLVGPGFSEISLASKSSKLTIVHLNDIHGRVKEDDYEKAIGFPKLKAKLDELRGQGEVLVLNAGDSLHGNTIINLSQGASMVDLMNRLGFDFMVPGNHDLNYGYERLLELRDRADFEIVTANVLNREGKSDFKPYGIKELDGLKLGIFGLTTDESEFKTHPDNIRGIDFLSPVETARKLVTELEDEGVDFIICLGHLGINGTSRETSKDVMEAVEGIDLFVDGHSHEVLNESFGSRLLVQAGDYGRNIGLVELELEEGQPAKMEASLVGYEELLDLEADQEIEGLIKEIEEKNRPVLEEVVGQTLVDLDGKRENVRTRETNLGNLLTDAMIRYTKGDIAFLNGGDIRADIKKGDVSVGDIISCVPFSSMLTVIEVGEEELFQALERGVDSYPESAGHFPQVSGIEYSFDPGAAPGERIVGLKVLGQELDRKKPGNRKFNMVTNDFITAGGDGYTMLKDRKLVSEEGLLLSDILISYLKEEKEINPGLEGRIKVQDKGDLKILVNKELLRGSDEMGRPFIDKNNRTLLPLRLVSEKLGQKVDWEPKERLVRIDDRLEVKLGERFISLDGKKLEMDTEALIKEGRTYIPFRVVFEALGYDVDWNGPSKTVIIREASN